jgi:hypothetical protein
VFSKTARAEIIGCLDAKGIITGDDSGFRRTASFYQQNAGRLDLEAALGDVSDAYSISQNPKDYLFIPMRANSCDVPNENGDCFETDEMLRFEPLVARRVYQTYQLKPHHINHRADNPRMARGFILDVHYCDGAPMPARWREKYEASTGVDQPIDRYIEALIAVDTTKDPFLARGYKSGAIKFFSMGCDADHTACSVCGNIARNKNEFCHHIASGKRRFWPHPKIAGRSMMAYEKCRGVIFGELSAVDEPADPRADPTGDLMQFHAGLKTASDEEVRAFLTREAAKLPAGIAAALRQRFS